MFNQTYSCDKEAYEVDDDDYADNEVVVEKLWSVEEWHDAVVFHSKETLNFAHVW